MLEHKISRRTFLKTSAATTAVVATGTVGFHEWSQLKAEGEEAPTVITPTTCNGCTSKCGIRLFSKNGRVYRLSGQENHSYSKGKLCARGHGAATWPYSPDRLTQPLKKNENGDFEPISWEQAYEEIGTKLNEIVKKYGGESVVYSENPKTTNTFYSKRFLDAIGSPNYSAHSASCNLSRDIGYEWTVGSTPSSDVAKAKYVLFIGRSYGDGIRPGHLQNLVKAKQNGAKIVLVDPRLNNTAPFASEWLSIRPGTDLAFVLALSHVLVKEDLYDKDFVVENSVGFEEYAKELTKYTPEWAAEITGIPAEKIIEIAHDMAKAKPKAVVDTSWRGAFGCAYINSTETARAVSLYNALLGNIQQDGGSYFGAKPKLGSLDETKHPKPPKAKGKRFDGAGEAGRYPLVSPGKGMPQAVPDGVKDGTVKAYLVNHINPVRNFPDPAVWIDALKEIELLVVCDIQLSETAELAHYVLPEVSYLERDELVGALSGKKGAVYLRQKAIDIVHPECKPFDEIVVGLANAMGLGQYFNFTLEELNEANIAPLGITMAELREQGTITFEDNKAEMGKMPKLKTESGKIEFYSKAYEEAGFNAVPQWYPPKTMPDENSFRLITGKQSIHSHSSTANLESLMQITKDYDLERLWINAERAKALGIKDGDMVEVESDLAKSQVRVKVTERLHPEAVFIPSGYGSFSKGLTIANGVGFSYNDHAKHDTEPTGGGVMCQEAIVRIRKVGA
ncbi:molybdopterin-dependent oxidoreductase [Rubeoparvulum massiliense]|uniref:molybdopterin-dependent oxidoreductase n=1 Tax=Rubeoparvulum massiliense TaxID=1631346 RepID=UPI00065DD746|nr:molybdopterin-dependent oxidoreductase [Rubeoparvulum massiliense]